MKNSNKTRKGQYLTVEEIYLVGIGLMLVIGLTAMVNTMNSSILDSVKSEQGLSVENLIVGNIEKLKNEVTGTDAEASVELKIPPEIGGAYYYITGSETDNGIIIKDINGNNITKKETSIPVEGLVHSQSKRMKITLFETSGVKRITIRSVSY